MIKSSPNYFTFLTQDHALFFQEEWEQNRLAKLMGDLTWIDTIEADGTTVSRDYAHENFPLYAWWPNAWKTEYRNAEKAAAARLDELLREAEKHSLGDEVIVYILGEDVFLSTRHYNRAIA